jgi:hypothetical protein
VKYCPDAFDVGWQLRKDVLRLNTYNADPFQNTKVFKVFILRLWTDNEDHHCGFGFGEKKAFDRQKIEVWEGIA